VVGDFSLQSADSRTFHPFAVGRSHIDGVATMIYWPPDRWHIFR
jgi:hypothetical protein